MIHQGEEEEKACPGSQHGGSQRQNHLSQHLQTGRQHFPRFQGIGVQRMQTHQADAHCQRQQCHELHPQCGCPAHQADFRHAQRCQQGVQALRGSHPRQRMDGRRQRQENQRHAAQQAGSPAGHSPERQRCQESHRHPRQCRSPCQLQRIDQQPSAPAGGQCQQQPIGVLRQGSQCPVKQHQQRTQACQPNQAEPREAEDGFQGVPAAAEGGHQCRKISVRSVFARSSRA